MDRTDDRDGLQDRGKPSIQLNEEQAIVVREPDAALHLTSQHNQLMPERRVLCLKPAFDLNGEAKTVRTKHSSAIIMR